ITGFLRSAGTAQPLLIILEDLHWADRGTLDFLVHLSRNLQGARLLIIGTYRDVEVDRQHPLSGALGELRRIANFGRVPLRGLTADEVHRMLNGLTGQEVRWSLAEAVHRQTEGNPLFIQEVIRYLVEEGHISHEGGRWHRAGESAPEMHIPEGLRDVIGRRLSRLSAECNRLLAVAAVIGRDFTLQALEAVADTPEEALVTALEEATRIGIVEEYTRPGSISYRFTHAFFQQTLYEELSGPRRLRMHQQVARALERIYGRRLEEHAAELAQHYAQSTDANDLRKAVVFGELAAKRASGVYAYGEAVRHLEQALEVQEILDPDDKARRCDLLLALGEAVQVSGDNRRAADTIAPAAFELAETLLNRPKASRVCRLALRSLGQYGSGAAFGSPEWRQWAQRADRAAAPGTVDRAFADLQLARAEWAAGDQTSAWSRGRRGHELAIAIGNEASLAMSFQVLLGWHGPPELSEERRELGSHLLSWAAGFRESGEMTDAWVAGLTLIEWADRAAIELFWKALAERASKTAEPHTVEAVAIVQVFRGILDGRLEQAVALAQLTLAGGEDLSGPVFMRRWVGYATFQAHLNLGKAGDVLTAARVLFEDDARRLTCLAHLGRWDEVRAELGSTIEQHSGIQGPDFTPTHVLVALLEAAVLAGDRATAAKLTGRLDRAASNTDCHNLTAIGRHLGGAAALLGDPIQAERYYERALELCRRLRFRPEIALTRLQLAELLLDHHPDRRAEAVDHLDFAIAEFRAMKMTPSLERALRRKGVLGA
ncbi:MAG: hypothetical protein AAB289_02610, partial [Chloroflexota bacterium]